MTAKANQKSIIDAAQSLSRDFYVQFSMYAVLMTTLIYLAVPANAFNIVYATFLGFTGYQLHAQLNDLKFAAEDGPYKHLNTSMRNYGFQILMVSNEFPILAFTGPFFFAIALKIYGAVYNNYVYHVIYGQSTYFGFLFLLFPYPIGLFIVFASLFVHSQVHSVETRDHNVDLEFQNSHIQWNCKELETLYKGKKMPMETAIEAWQDQKIDFKQGCLEAIKARYDLFRMCFTIGHLKSLVYDFIYRLWKHDSEADKADISDVYNRGNDFYAWFLCSKMLYSVAHFDNSAESQFVHDKEGNKKMNAMMDVAQDKKLDSICKDHCMMKEGDLHLDLGCGWGAMVLHATKNYKVKSMGITLAKEQAAEIKKRDHAMNNGKDTVDIKVMNFWDLDESENYKKFDVITCLEMSEHIGVRDYQLFLRKVRTMLKDTGVFYLQIAGLRRSWQYEDLCWGLFMNRYVFPGADASCPLYWDVEQLERSCFECRKIESWGCSYGLTIRAWYENWELNKPAVVKKYGEWAWRNWAIFLSWSYQIAMQGSSTVWMISMHKNMPHDVESRLEPFAVREMKKTVDSKKETENVFGISRIRMVVDQERDAKKL